MSGSHNHDHSHVEVTAKNAKKLTIALALTFTFLIVEVVAGFITAPMNTGSALNFIQTAIQMMADPKRKKPLELVEKCRKTFRVVDNMPLPEHHKVRHQELLQQFNKLKEEKRYSR